MPGITDALRFTRLRNDTLAPDLLVDPTGVSVGTVGTTGQLGTAAANAYYFAAALRQKTENEANVAGTSDGNLYSGETLKSSSVGTPALGTGQTYRFTFSVGTLADALRIYKGTDSVTLWLYAEADISHAGDGSILGGTNGPGTWSVAGVIGTTGGGTQITWDDPTPLAAIGTANGRGATVNRAEDNCVLFQGPGVYRPRPFAQIALEKELASGVAGQIVKGYRFYGDVELLIVGTTNEADADTIAGYPYLRFYPQADTGSSRSYDCYMQAGGKDLLAQFYTSAKRAYLGLRGMALFSAPETLFP